MDTRTDLVEKLESVPRTPLIEKIIAEAKAGEFHDFKNRRYAAPKVELYGLLIQAGLQDLATDVRNGLYDEEADAEDLAEMNTWFEPENLRKHPPRIRGRVGQLEDGEWIFEITLSTQNLKHQGTPRTFGPYATQERAEKALEEAVRVISDEIERAHTGKVSGTYVDMKDGQVKKWKK